MKAHYTNTILTIIAALLAGLLAERLLQTPANVRVINNVSLRDPVSVRFAGPQQVQICDDSERCADLYPAQITHLPGPFGGDSTRWGLMIVPPPQR
jgi:hypothetical protein